MNVCFMKPISLTQYRLTTVRLCIDGTFDQLVYAVPISARLKIICTLYEYFGVSKDKYLINILEYQEKFSRHSTA